MKKLLFTALLIASAITFSFSSTPNTGEQATNSISTYAYQYTNYYVGDLYGIQPEFTVNFSGEYLGNEGYVFRLSGYKFTTDPYAFTKGNNIHIGNVVTLQNGQVVIYQIYANLK